MLVDSLRPNEALPHLCPTVMCESMPMGPPPEGSHLEPQPTNCKDCGRQIDKPFRCPACAVAEDYRLWSELHKIFTGEP